MKLKSSLVVALLFVPTLALADVFTQEFQSKISAKEKKWQWSGVTLGERETAEIRISGTWKTINPDKYGEHGPEGINKRAHGGYVVPGKRKGAALVKLEDDGSEQVLSWEDAIDGVLKIKGPGKIFFICNDVPNPKNEEDTRARFMWIVWGDPPGQRMGYKNNSGELAVKMSVTSH